MGILEDYTTLVADPAIQSNARVSGLAQNLRQQIGTDYNTLVNASDFKSNQQAQQLAHQMRASGAVDDPSQGGLNPDPLTPQQRAQVSSLSAPTPAQANTTDPYSPDYNPPAPAGLITPAPKAAPPQPWWKKAENAVEGGINDIGAALTNKPPVKTITDPQTIAQMREQNKSRLLASRQTAPLASDNAFLDSLTKDQAEKINTPGYDDGERMIGQRASEYWAEQPLLKERQQQLADQQATQAAQTASDKRFAAIKPAPGVPTWQDVQKYALSAPVDDHYQQPIQDSSSRELSQMANEQDANKRADLSEQFAKGDLTRYVLDAALNSGAPNGSILGQRPVNMTQHQQEQAYNIAGTALLGAATGGAADAAAAEGLTGGALLRATAGGAANSALTKVAGGIYGAQSLPGISDAYQKLVTAAPDRYTSQFMQWSTDHPKASQSDVDAVFNKIYQGANSSRMQGKYAAGAVAASGLNPMAAGVTPGRQGVLDYLKSGDLRNAAKQIQLAGYQDPTDTLNMGVMGVLGAAEGIHGAINLGSSAIDSVQMARTVHDINGYELTGPPKTTLDVAASIAHMGLKDENGNITKTVITPVQAARVKMVLDKWAQVWSKETGKPTSDFVTQNIGQVKDILATGLDNLPDDIRAQRVREIAAAAAGKSPTSVPGAAGYTQASGAKTLGFHPARADVTTVMHEMTHMFVDSLPDSAKSNIAKTFGFDPKAFSDPTSPDYVAAHERVARGLERRLYEGSSPNLAQANLYQNFRKWFQQSYATPDNDIHAHIITAENNPEMQEFYNSIISGKKFSPGASVASVISGTPRNNGQQQQPAAAPTRRSSPRQVPEAILKQQGIIDHGTTAEDEQRQQAGSLEAQRLGSTASGTAGLGGIQSVERAGQNGEDTDANRATQRRPGVLEQRPEVVSNKELHGDGRSFAGFFGDVTKNADAKHIPFSGHGAQPGETVSREYQPLIKQSPSVQSFAAVRQRFSGNFDNHIATSIPGYNEVQNVVGDAISKTYGQIGGSVLDIGASEGALGKAISYRTNGRVSTVSLDPNIPMRDTFNSKPQANGARFDLSAFSDKDSEGKPIWNESDGTPINGFDPKGKKFDVVHEGMVFQFISNTRNAQIARTKELLKPGGVALFEEKLGGSAQEYRNNEAKKDAEWKSKYYTQAQIAAKAAQVLKTGEDAAEGMTDKQVASWEMESILKKHFKYAVQYWDSGNFKGYAASDSLQKIKSLVGNMQDTNTEFSTTQTPRVIESAEVRQATHLAQQGHTVHPQEDTENFRKWAGGAHVPVIDAPQTLPEGPHVVRVFHGTGYNQPFDTFKLDRGDLGYHFGSADQANSRIHYLSLKRGDANHYPEAAFSTHEGMTEGRFNALAHQTRVHNKAWRVIPGYVRMTHPLRLPDIGSWKPDDVISALINLDSEEFNNDELNEAEKQYNLGNEDKSRDMIVKVLKKHGYDSIVYKNEGEFDPEYDKRIEANKKAYNGMDAMQMIMGGDAKTRVTDAALRGYLTNPDNRKDSFIALDKNQFKSSIANNGKFSNAQPSFLRQKSHAPEFYSAAEKVIREKAPNRFGADQLLGLLSASNGVKQDELKWSGLDDLAQQAKVSGRQLTKQEVLDHLRDNNVSVSVKKLGDPEAHQRLVQKLGDKYGGDLSKATDEEMDDYYRLRSQGSTQYSNSTYNLPGHDNNYQEHLLRIEKQTDHVRKQRERFKAINDKNEAAWLYAGLSEEPNAEYLSTTPSEQYKFGLTPEEIEERQSIQNYLNGLKRKNEATYSPPHFNGEQNLIAYIRFSDRTGPKGEKLLHMEELQSDMSNALHTKKDEIANAKYGGVGHDGKPLFPEYPDSVLGDNNELPYRALSSEHKAAVDRFLSLSNPELNKPLVKNWHELALKHALRTAAEGGYYGLSWTPGIDHAERWNMANHVDRLDYIPPGTTGRKGETSGTLRAYRHGGEVANYSVSPDDLPGYIGKPASSALLATKPEITRGSWPSHTLNNDDLRIVNEKGQGKQALYDKMVPNYLNKFGKRFGAQVGETQIGINNGLETYDGAGGLVKQPGDHNLKTVPRIPITNSMKKSVLGEGVPLFQVSHEPNNPFHDQAVDKLKEYSRFSGTPEGAVADIEKNPYMSARNGFSSLFIDRNGDVHNVGAHGHTQAALTVLRNSGIKQPADYDRGTEYASADNVLNAKSNGIMRVQLNTSAASRGIPYVGAEINLDHPPTMPQIRALATLQKESGAELVGDLKDSSGQSYYAHSLAELQQVIDSHSAPQSLNQIAHPQYDPHDNVPIERGDLATEVAPPRIDPFHGGRYRATKAVNEPTYVAMNKVAGASEEAHTYVKYAGDNVLRGLTPEEAKDVVMLGLHNRAASFAMEGTDYNTAAVPLMSDEAHDALWNDPKILAAVLKHQSGPQSFIESQRSFLHPGMTKTQTPDNFFLSLIAKKDAAGNEIESTGDTTRPGGALGSGQRVKSSRFATQHATGRASEYSTDYREILEKSVNDVMTKARLKALYKTMLGQIDAQGNKLAYSDAFGRELPTKITFNGVTYSAKVVEYRLAQIGANDHKMLRIAVPEQIEKDIADVTSKPAKLTSAADVWNKAQGFATTLQLTTPAEITRHVSRMLSVVSAVPPVGQASVGQRMFEALPVPMGYFPGVGMVTPAKLMSLHRMFNLDFSDPEDQNILLDIMRNNAGSSRAFTPQVHIMDGVGNWIGKQFPKAGQGMINANHFTHDFLFSLPEGKGLKGFDLRLRVMAEKMRRAVEGNTDPTRIREFANQFGQYTTKPDSLIEHLKVANPFTATTAPVQLTEFKQLIGDAGFKNLHPKDAAVLRAETLFRGAGGAILGGLLANHLLSGHWNWQNSAGHEQDIQIGKDKDGKPIYFAGTAAMPNVSRPVRDTGLADALEDLRSMRTSTPQQKFAQIAKDEGRAAYNEGGSLIGSPLLKAVTVGAGGIDPTYLTKGGGPVQVSERATKANGQNQEENNLVSAFAGLNQLTRGVGNTHNTGYDAQIYRQPYGAMQLSQSVLGNMLKKDGPTRFSARENENPSKAHLLALRQQIASGTPRSQVEGMARHLTQTGQLSPNDFRDLMLQPLPTPGFEMSLERLPVDQALGVYETLNSHQKSQSRALMIRKVFKSINSDGPLVGKSRVVRAKSLGLF